MREYSKVRPQFWTGTTGKAIRAGGPKCQVLALYLVSSDHSNMIGLYRIPVPFICHETGLTIADVERCLGHLSEVGFCDFDTQTEHVWVRQMARYQVADELKIGEDKEGNPKPDKRIPHINKLYANLADNPFLGPFFDRYGVSFHLKNRRDLDEASEGHGRALQGVSKPPRSQEQEQEQEQEQRVYQEKSSIGTEVTLPSDSEEGFDDTTYGDAGILVPGSGVVP